jgi:hypothetical protein
MRLPALSPALARASHAVATDRVSATPHGLDDVEVARRLLSLISLLGIYVMGLLLVAILSDGPDIGVLLVALFSHASFVGVRAGVREFRHRGTVLAAGRRGLLVIGRRVRVIRYGEIASAAANETTLTLRLRRGGERITLRFADVDPAARERFLERVFGRVRLAAAEVRSRRSRSRESLAKVAAALGQLASVNIKLPSLPTSAASKVA